MLSECSLPIAWYMSRISLLNLCTEKKMNGVKFLFFNFVQFFPAVCTCIVVVYQSSGNNGNNISTLLSSGEQGMINNVMREMKRLFRVYRVASSLHSNSNLPLPTLMNLQTTMVQTNFCTCNQTIGSFVLTQIGHHCSHLLFFRVS